MYNTKHVLDFYQDYLQIYINIQFCDFYEYIYFHERHSLAFKTHLYGKHNIHLIVYFC